VRTILFLLIIHPVVLSAFNPVDKYLKKDEMLSRVAGNYLKIYGTRIVTSNIFNLLIRSGIYDVEHAAFSGKFKSLKEFKMHIKNKMSWQLMSYSHIGYNGRGGRYFAVLIKRYVDLDFVGYRGKNLYVITGKLRPGIEKIMACVQGVRGNIYHVLPSITVDRRFTFKFSGKGNWRNCIFELMVVTEHEGRRVAGIVRQRVQERKLSKVSFNKPRDASRYLIKLINKERVSRGLTPLVPDILLSSIALSHSKEMAKRKRTFHSDIDKKVASIGEFYSKLSENVGASKFIDGIHSGFINSPLHLKNILDEQVSKVGVGVEYAMRGGEKYIYAAQIFFRPYPVHKNKLTGSYFTSYINSERKKRGVPPLQYDRKLYSEAKLFLKREVEFDRIADFFSLSGLNLKRIAYNHLTTQSLFSTRNNPAFYEKEFTHLALVIPEDKNLKKKSLIILASYRK